MAAASGDNNRLPRLPPYDETLPFTTNNQESKEKYNIVTDEVFDRFAEAGVIPFSIARNGELYSGDPGKAVADGPVEKRYTPMPVADDPDTLLRGARSAFGKIQKFGARGTPKPVPEDPESLLTRRRARLEEMQNSGAPEFTPAPKKGLLPRGQTRKRTFTAPGTPLPSGPKSVLHRGGSGKDIQNSMADLSA